MISIYQKIDKHRQLNPQKLAVVHGDKSLSYAQLIAQVDTIAANLLSFNASKPLRIALHLKNSIELLTASIAAAKLGWTIIPLNISLRPEQLKKQLEVTQVEAVITSNFSYRTIKKALPEKPALKLNDLLLTTTESCAPKDQKLDLNRDFIITLSSGSTGNPKPIALSQKAKLLRSRQALELYSVAPNDVILCASPFYHSLGQRLFFLPLLSGATLIILDHFTVDAWIKAVEQHSVTFTIAVSSHIQALRNQLLEHTPVLQSLRCLVSSSAQISHSLKRDMLENLNCEFHEMYGATEIATATNLSPHDDPSKSATVGNVICGIDIKILDDKRRPLPAGETGEIACKTPLMFNGYDHLETLTADAMWNSYFLTGDLGYLDEDGFLYFTTRKKDIVITGGINVIPQDIESVLQQHPDIQDCTVIGINDDYLGEVVFAICATPEPNREGLETEVRLFINDKLAGFQQPFGYSFVKKIPLTGSGKPDKQKLRKEYNALNLKLSEKIKR